jgi:hypothetical protein
VAFWYSMELWVIQPSDHHFDASRRPNGCGVVAAPTTHLRLAVDSQFQRPKNFVFNAYICRDVLLYKSVACMGSDFIIQSPHHTMHPHHWTHRPRFFWGPSRIIWFAIGATAATWYHHSKDPERRRVCAERMNHWRSGHLSPPPYQGDLRAEDRYYGQQAPPPPHPSTPSQSWEYAKQQEPVPSAPEQYAEPIPPTLPTQPQAREPAHSPWEWDSRATDNVVAEISRRASETVSSMIVTIRAQRTDIRSSS